MWGKRKSHLKAVRSAFDDRTSRDVRSLVAIGGKADMAQTVQFDRE
jgi:hypothetical protein